MDYTTLLEETKAGNVPSRAQLPSLYQVCQQIADGRKARGKRYDLAGILLLLIAGKLAGMSSILAVSEWVKDQETMIRASLDLPWKRMPCADTYSYVLARLERKPGQRPSGSVVCAPGGSNRKRLRRWTYSSGHRRQNA